MRSLISTFAFLVLTTAGPARADTVTCADGSKSTAGRGACSYHGGVAKRTTTTAKPRTQTPARADNDRSSTRRADNDKPSTRRPDNSSNRVRCEDGTTSVAARGACARHGGVESEARTRADRRADSELPQRDRPTARCSDGTLSYSARHSGTCSYHGGVADWL